MDAILFLVFASIAVACGINVVLQRHPINSALSLIGVMGSLAVLYLLLGGEFIAAAQIIVYAGAVMVLFLFVIMLLNAGRERTQTVPWVVRLLGPPALILFVSALGVIAYRLLPYRDLVRFGEFTRGGAADVGRPLLTTYVLPFEVTTVAILVAIVGAVLLARKEGGE